MKLLIIFIISVLATVAGAQAQCKLPYKSQKEFGNDTTAFILYNFMDRAECYKGKTLKEIFYDLQMPVKDIVISYDMKTGKFTGLSLYVYEDSRVIYMRDSHIDYTPIHVAFENIDINRSYFYDATQGTGERADDILYDMCKDYTVSKTKIILSEKSKYYSKYKDQLGIPKVKRQKFKEQKFEGTFTPLPKEFQ